jgi:hypothetical protein
MDFSTNKKAAAKAKEMVKENDFGNELRRVPMPPLGTLSEFVVATAVRPTTTPSNKTPIKSRMESKDCARLTSPSSL